MKKLICLLVMLFMTFAICGCGADNGADASSEAASSAKAASSAESESEVSSQKDDSSSQGSSGSGGQIHKPEFTHPIDLEKLDSIERADNFALKVTGVKIENAYFSDFSLVGDDCIVLSLKNSTGAKIQKFTVLVLCTTEDKEGCRLESFTVMAPSFGTHNGETAKYSDCVQVMGTDTADLANNSDKDYAIRCDADGVGIKKVNAIVHSYVDADGKEIINENYINWLKNTAEMTVVK